MQIGYNDNFTKDYTNINVDNLRNLIDSVLQSLDWSFVLLEDFLTTHLNSRFR